MTKNQVPPARSEHGRLASTPSEAERSKKAKISQYTYILLYTEGRPCSEEFVLDIIGVYSSKTLATQNAKVAFEDRSIIMLPR